MKKKLLSFLGLWGYALGSIGGFGYAAYCGQWLIAFCVIVLAYLAYPKAREFFKELWGE